MRNLTTCLYLIKGAHKLKRKDFENNLNLDIQDGDGVLVKQSKFEDLVQGTDNQLYFEEHHTNIRNYKCSLC